MFEDKRGVPAPQNNSGSAESEQSQRSLIGRTRSGESIADKIHAKFRKILKKDLDPDDPFHHVLGALDAKETEDLLEIEEDLRRLYLIWATEYEYLKQEFTAAYALFCEIEDLVQGWFVESPNLGQWRPVGQSSHGYTFAACISKNHRRGAPFPEKSLSITFGLSELRPGIGDETWLGRQTPISDVLTGLEDCSGKSLREQHDAVKKMVKLLYERRVTVRMNHKELGQHTAQIELDGLKKHSLRSVCQGLFVGLNNDILTQGDPLELPANSVPLLEAI